MYGLTGRLNNITTNMWCLDFIFIKQNFSSFIFSYPIFKISSLVDIIIVQLELTINRILSFSPLSHASFMESRGGCYIYIYI